MVFTKFTLVELKVHEKVTVYKENNFFISFKAYFWLYKKDSIV